MTQRVGKGSQVLAADAYDADRAFARWRGHRDDGRIAFAKHGLKHEPPLARAHC